MSHFLVQNLLSGYVDGDLSPADLRRVETHLRGCEECRRECELLRQTVELLRALPSEPAPGGFADRVMERVAGEKPPSRGDGWGRVIPFPVRRAAPWALAASALLAVGLAVGTRDEAPREAATASRGETSFPSSPPSGEAAGGGGGKGAGGALEDETMDGLVDGFDVATGADERPLAARPRAPRAETAAGEAPGGKQIDVLDRSAPADEPAPATSAAPAPGPVAGLEKKAEGRGTFAAGPSGLGRAASPPFRIGTPEEPFMAEWEKDAPEAEPDGGFAPEPDARPSARDAERRASDSVDDEDAVASRETGGGDDAGFAVRGGAAKEDPAARAPAAQASAPRERQQARASSSGGVASKSAAVLVPRLDLTVQTSDRHALLRLEEACVALALPCRWVEPRDRAGALDAQANYQRIEVEVDRAALDGLVRRLQPLGSVIRRGDTPADRHLARITVEYLP